MREAILQLEESKIREVANAGMGRSDVLAFWFGESDEVTPDFIRQAAITSLQQGETFYAHNLGLPELRKAIVETLLHQTNLWTVRKKALAGFSDPNVILIAALFVAVAAAGVVRLTGGHLDAVTWAGLMRSGGYALATRLRP